MQAKSARKNRRASNPLHVQSEGIISMNRSRVSGTLQENILTIKGKMQPSKSSHEREVQHLAAVLEVANVISTRPIMATQEAASMYLNCKKRCHSGTDALGLPSMPSSTLYEILSKHLNIILIYINGKAYIIENTGSNLEKLLETITGTMNTEKIVNERVYERLEDIFTTTLRYLDTPRDRQVMKGIISHITSIKFSTKLQGLKSKQGTMAAKKAFIPKLQKYKSIERKSQLVQSDLTTKQQYKLTRRIISARKTKEYTYHC